LIIWWCSTSHSDGSGALKGLLPNGCLARTGSCSMNPSNTCYKWLCIGELTSLSLFCLQDTHGDLLDYRYHDSLTSYAEHNILLPSSSGQLRSTRKGHSVSVRPNMTVANQRPDYWRILARLCLIYWHADCKAPIDDNLSVSHQLPQLCWFVAVKRKAMEPNWGCTAR
jgi:hypothetical protein